MKKLLAILFAVLMVVPFATFASAAETVQLPAEPTVAADAPKYYVGHEGAGDMSGKDAANYAPTHLSSTKEGVADALVWNKIAQGGYLIVEYKFFFNQNYTLETQKPVLITALDPADGINNVVLENGDLNTAATSADSNPNGQIGMVMVDCPEPITFTIKSDLIFKDTALLHRSTKNNVTYAVADGGKLVIDSSVKFGKTGSCFNAGFGIYLDVAEGGYAFLHSAGFDKYTGKGTIVVDDAMVSLLDYSLFAEFEGKLVNSKGEVLEIPKAPVDSDPVDSTPADSTPDSTPAVSDEVTDKATDKVTDKVTDKATEKVTDKATEKADVTTKAADTTTTTAEEDSSNVTIIIIAAVAAAVVVAAVVIIIIKKKKA